MKQAGNYPGNCQIAKPMGGKAFTFNEDKKNGDFLTPPSLLLDGLFTVSYLLAKTFEKPYAPYALPTYIVKAHR